MSAGSHVRDEWRGRLRAPPFEVCTVTLGRRGAFTSVSCTGEASVLPVTPSPNWAGNSGHPVWWVTQATWFISGGNQRNTWFYVCDETVTAHPCPVLYDSACVCAPTCTTHQVFVRNSPDVCVQLTRCLCATHQVFGHDSPCVCETHQVFVYNSPDVCVRLTRCLGTAHQVFVYNSPDVCV